MNRDYLLEPGELRNEFPGWDILHYSEGAPPGRRAVAEIVARRRRRSGESVETAAGCRYLGDS